MLQSVDVGSERLTRYHVIISEHQVMHLRDVRSNTCHSANVPVLSPDRAGMLKRGRHEVSEALSKRELHEALRQLLNYSTSFGSANGAGANPGSSRVSRPKFWAHLVLFCSLLRLILSSEISNAFGRDVSH